MQLATPNLNDALREGGRTDAGGGRNWLRNLLVVGEIALSLVLLVGASLFMRSFLNLQLASGGFDTAQLLTLRFYLPGESYEHDGAKGRRVSDIVSRVEGLTGVEAAAASNLVPLDGGGDVSRLEVEGVATEAGREPRTFFAGVTPHFFRVLDLPMIRGREFTQAEGEQAVRLALVNVSFARRFLAGSEIASTAPDGDGLRGAADLGAIDPVGRRFRLLDAESGTDWLTVIGVVPDILVDEISDSGTTLASS